MPSTLQCTRALFLTSLLLLALGSARAQIDTTGGKFYQPLYTVQVTSGIQFGTYPGSGGTAEPLYMDVYQPQPGPTQPRPLLILAHGGAFLFGSRTDGDVVELCTRFARLGYVTASIDYRLHPGLSLPTAPDVVRAMQDMRAAVRFFRADAAGSNQFNLNPSYIFAGGSSAGAVTALHLAFLDTQTELDALNAGVPGGLEGTGGNAGYVSAVRAVVNLCGAVGDLSWLQPGDEPFVSVHGTNDAVVPYGAGTFFGIPLYGSGVLKPRADAVGVPSTLRTFRGAGHVPFSGGSTANVRYMDTTFWVVRDFLRPQLAGAAPLPVTLTRFEASRQGSDALLIWETATEKNSAGYEVQTSGDGEAFRTIGFVRSETGFSLTPRRYQFRDAENGKTGPRYYRLRQLDLDGQASLFGPRVVSFSSESIALTAHPNPFDHDLTLTVSLAEAAGPARLQLHNSIGRIVLDQPLTLPAGTSRLPLPPLTKLPAGTYTLTLQCGQQVLHRRLVKH